MTLSAALSWARRLAGIPPRELAARIARRAARATAPVRDLARTTYSGKHDAPSGDLVRIIGAFPRLPEPAWLAQVTDLVLQHRFRLLGSDWVRVHHGMIAQGIEGVRFPPASQPRVDREGRWLDARTSIANRAESRRIWRMVDEGYEPIDWHIDFKSGYRWNPARHHSSIRYGDVRGADVKVPWELARCQHHLWLARAFAQAHEAGDRDRAERLRREFRNQVLDFVACNPPRYGVNWAMPMDIAIRAANWLLALDLFRAASAQFDAEFLALLKTSAFEHGAHVLEYLEWSATLRSNHYLADIVGLLFIAAYLPRSGRVDAWLAFAVQELHGEMLGQFGADGGNFEASTSYHRLSCEMALYGTALILGLNENKRAALVEFNEREHRRQPALRAIGFAPSAWVKIDLSPLSDAYFYRLRQAVAFTEGIMRADGRVPQIGDADSGRFFKASPAFELEPVSNSWREDFLDHRHLVAAFDGLFESETARAPAGDLTFERELIHEVAGSAHTRVRDAARSPLAEVRDVMPADPSASSDTTLVIDLLLTQPQAAGDTVLHSAYPDFGLYLMQTSHLHLALRCGAIGQNGVGGHAHNDQLSFELALAGRLVFADRGSFLYTPFAEWRNEFRSTAAHSTIIVPSREQNDWLPGRAGLFSLLTDRADASVEYFGNGSVRARHVGFGAPVRRTLEVLPDRVRISDSGPRIRSHFCLAPGIAPSVSDDGSVELRDETREALMILRGEDVSWRIAESWHSAAYGEKIRTFDLIAMRGNGR